MRLGWKLDPYGITGRYLPSGQNDTHDARLADDLALLVTLERRGHEPWLDLIELHAGVPETGHFDDSGIAQAEPSPRGQREQMNPARGDVLTHLSSRHGEAVRPEAVVKLGVDQMDLAQIRLARIARDPRAMLNRPAHVRVTLDPESLQEPDALPTTLAELVLTVPTHSRYPSFHSARIS